MFLGVGMVAAMLLAASSAMAGGLNLAWSNCLGDGGLPNRVNACTSNAGSAFLSASFVVDADITGATGIAPTVDFIAGDGTSALPPWWQMLGAGQCRGTPAALSANVSLPATAVNCVDWAQGGATGAIAGGIQTATPPSGWSIAPANEPAHGRIVLASAVPSNAPVDLTTGTEYFAFNLSISNRASVGTGSCAGCSTGGCWVLNSIKISQGITDLPPLTTGVSAGSNIATYQSTTPNCQLVPTRTTTWSTVKRMYHN
jgi:hypothetical protein